MLSVIYQASKMIDFCSCCNKCSSTRQLSTYPSYSFSKKLLVAISLVVIIAMFITPSESRTIERRRHRHVPQTKESFRPLRTRHHNSRRPEELRLAPTKELKNRSPLAKIYTKESRKILKKMKNTRSFFKEDQRTMKELNKYSERVPEWLPTVNFVEIHFHDYNSNRSKKEGSTIPERKFKYLMPRLYKSLVEYEELFKRFQQVVLDFPDTTTDPYKPKRARLLRKTLEHLYSTIQEVNDSMTAVNITVPPLKNKLDLSSLQMRVDTTQCLRNDYLAFRGYGHLLNNWILEFKCPKKGKMTNKNCRIFEDKLKEKLDRKSVKGVLLKYRSRTTT